MGDSREIFQGDGHSNQCVAVAINGEIAKRLVDAANGDTELLRRAAAFISEHDPFGDHFSAHDLARLDPGGGYVETCTYPACDGGNATGYCHDRCFMPPESNDTNALG